MRLQLAADGMTKLPLAIETYGHMGAQFPLLFVLVRLLATYHMTSADDSAISASMAQLYFPVS